MDPREYLELETLLTSRIQKEWSDRAEQVFAPVQTALDAEDFEAAKGAAMEIDLSPIGEAVKDFAYMMYRGFIDFGAQLAAQGPSLTSSLEFDQQVKTMVNQMLQYMEWNATATAQDQALQLIALAEQRVLVQKANPYHDEDGKFTSKENDASWGTTGAKEGTLVSVTSGGMFDSKTKFYLAKEGAWHQTNAPGMRDGKPFATLTPDGEVMSDEAMSLSSPALVREPSDHPDSVLDVEAMPVGSKIQTAEKEYEKTSEGWKNLDGEVFQAEHMDGLFKNPHVKVIRPVKKANPYHDELGRFSTKDKAKFVSIGPAWATLREKSESFEVVAYHGTPEEFTQFDLQKVSSDPYSHLFGFGIYLASAREVAEVYATDPETMKTGSVYTVGVRAKSSDMLDMDAPIGATPEIQKRLTPLVDTAVQRLSAFLAPKAVRGLKTGFKSGTIKTSEVYEFLRMDTFNDLAQGRQSFKEVGTLLGSKLKAAGVPGARYKDAGTKMPDGSKGHGSQNFVLFSDSDLKIIKKKVESEDLRVGRDERGLFLLYIAEVDDQKFWVKSYKPQESIQKANPYHDELGRFASKDEATFVSIGGVFSGPNEKDRETKDPAEALPDYSGPEGGKDTEAIFGSSYEPATTADIPEKAKFTRKLTPEQIKALTPGQPAVDVPGVNRYVKDLKYGSKFPIIVVQPNGKHVIQDGHHQLVAAMLRGEPLLVSYGVLSKNGRWMTPDAGKQSLKKAEPLRPFTSFADNTNASLQLIATLHASRLSGWGFIAESDLIGHTTYKLSAMLDNRTSDFCRYIDGKEFTVESARGLIDEAIHADDPNSLREIHPWPNQSKAGMAEVMGLSAEELAARGYHVPPFHPGCRTLMVHVATKAPMSKPKVKAPPIPEQQSTLQTFKDLGLGLTEGKLAVWNDYVGLNPLNVLTTLTQQSAMDVLKLKNWGLQITAKGNIKIDWSGKSLVLDPVKASLAYKAPTGALEFGASADAVLEYAKSVGATTVTMRVSPGEAGAALALGVVPPAVEWQALRLALKALVAGPLATAVSSLSSEEKLRLWTTLESNTQSSASALGTLPKAFTDLLLKDVKYSGILAVV